MKTAKIPAIALMIALLAACSGQGAKDKDKKKNDSTATEENGNSGTQLDASVLEGSYMGTIGNYTLIVSINYVSGKNISGYNIVKGNRRNIKGTVVQDGNVFSIEMKEPGTDQYDGVFKFSIDPQTLKGTGTWTPNDPKATSAKNIRLEKKDGEERSNDLTGEWYGHGMTLMLRKDGTVSLAGDWYQYDEETQLELSTPVDIKGTWIDKGNGKFSIEWQKNSVFKSAKMNFYRDTLEMYGVTDGGDWYFYAY